MLDVTPSCHRVPDPGVWCPPAEQTFIRQAFEGEYPKLVRLNYDLWTRLQQFSTPPAADGQPRFE